jgi:hypothetical protein
MVNCQNCGHSNSPDCNYCRFCGTKITVPIGQPQRGTQYNYAPPRPYAWKTDEFQTQAEARKNLEASPAAPVQQYYPDQLSYYQYAAMDGSYRCPRCGTSYLPVIERRVSSAGWIVFSLLLVFTLIFFWIGLLMREDVAVCPVCRARLN